MFIFSQNSISFKADYVTFHTSPVLCVLQIVYMSDLCSMSFQDNSLSSQLNVSQKYRCINSCKIFYFEIDQLCCASGAVSTSRSTQ